jgi:hypothetical protein
VTVADYYNDPETNVPAQKNGQNKGVLKAYKAQKRKEAEARQALSKAQMRARAVEAAEVGPETKAAMRVALGVMSPELFDRKLKEWLKEGSGVDF